ncbi:hypothetical protein BDA96_02G175300 [Sorghum bicolor]|uniref:PGG domain-containing protein n=2 Tax=Sorghum bicolor TaxID=4558 RepID=A0A1W0W4G1_SORBI|nr:hypothetical protein BDA96_02G175300 [Sorghum bicolor]OQU89270.1 hypothetical protein SORBI_3002G167300 [Sorghum bicolor]
MQPTPADVEQGIVDAVPRRHLKGVTMEGDTALHLVAANGDDSSFQKCAVVIHGKDKDLLCRQNNKGDTPLHCAARTAGRSEMVSHLIVLATVDNIVEQLLRQENNSNETVLHMAVRTGDHQLVKHLLAKDPKLACFPEKGTSPLYLAILLDQGSIAKMLYDESENNVLSYAGPNGQNALHAAVLRGPDVQACRTEDGVEAHVHANTAALYQPDNNGLYPIHVAAVVVGASVWLMRFERHPIPMFVKKCPSSAGLRDAKGRTFLHVAVEKKNVDVVWYACRHPSLAWVLNMQDGEGNTALHLAVRDGNTLGIFRHLFGSMQVNLNLTNAKKQTPRDIALYHLRPSFYFETANPEIWIKRALQIAGATRGVYRKDHFDEEYENHHGLNSDYNKDKELEMLKDSTQSRSIGSVLIATVTFGAMFALPGGYKADDHSFGGTPTPAGMYAFHAFMIANTIAFISSTIATLGFMFAGDAGISLARRKLHFSGAMVSTQYSITALTIAFALGVYTVLAPVAQKTAILICVISPLVVLYNISDFWCSAAYGRNNTISISISPAQAPARFT